MRGWNYALGSPNLGWMYHLTLEELQVIYSFSCLWELDRDPDIAFANDYDHKYRLTVRKLIDETGYDFRAGLTVDEALEVWVEHPDRYQDALAIKGFFDHVLTCLRVPGTPWPNYETAFHATVDFLTRELPQEHALLERVREEIAKIDEMVEQARLRGPDRLDIEEALREALKGEVN